MDSSRSSSTWHLVPTPTTSSIGSPTTDHADQPLPQPPAVLPGPLPVTILSANSWRTAYPRIGQFAMTESEEVVAAGPNGLFYFRRVRDHASMPWSEARPLPDTLMLNDSTVSGLAVRSSHLRLDVYCVSGGVLHNFYRSTEAGSSFVVNPHPPLSTYHVTGTPAIATTADNHYEPKGWSLVVPCHSGGLLHTWKNHPRLIGSSYPNEGWGPQDHVATDLGIISAVSVAFTQTSGSTHMDIVVVCVASGRLHTLEGRFARDKYSTSLRWKTQTSTRIHHPGEVTGNPTLVARAGIDQLDLLVPSAEGGVFHFVRTASTPDEWHMIARIGFPPGLPIASCLACNTDFGPQNKRRFNLLVQSGGRLYRVTTCEGARPWSGSYLEQIVAPGPFSD
ncbi:hypothetical protein NUW58_g2503 [Xylaria curta]|uniref:Uncharacterized protein n=1 Tax=Xylaria curta TaxID=42375 RepID=A0ACC1PHN3_9PEZI|nr:hypothetical protein NUW58_g2503 [Xylaria curta]